MKKYLKLTSLLSVLLLTSCNFKYSYKIVGIDDAGGGIGDGDLWEDTSGIDDSGTYDIKIWVDEKIEALTRSQIGSFEMAYGGKYTINANIEPMSEGAAATSMLQDVQSGADIFCFAQDQLARLKVAGAVSKITGSLKSFLQDTNSEDSIKAGSINDSLYSFPVTSDNGYFLYYNKSVVNEDQAKNMTTLLSALKGKGRTLNFEGRSNGWYAASYFLGTGCRSEWEIDDKTGKFKSYTDTFNSEEGVIAAKGLREIADASVVAKSATWSNKAGAIITGIWEYAALEEEWGDDLACAEMPYFTVDGKDYHLSSYDGYKLMGVKPQVDSKKASVCRKLAQFLTNRSSQLERFTSAKWGPTNKVVAERDDVKEQPGLAALAAQHEFATQQGQCPGAWFVALQATATLIETNTDESTIRSLLQTYEDGLDALKSED